MGIDQIVNMEPVHKWCRILKVGAIITIVALVTGCVVVYNEATTPSYYGPGPIDIIIQPDKPYFIQGDDVTFKITVINNQSWPITYPISQKIDIQKDGEELHSSNDMEIDYPTKIPTFPANTNTSLSWKWVESKNGDITASHQSGNYSISFYMKGHDYSTLAYCTFKIR